MGNQTMTSVIVIDDDQESVDTLSDLFRSEGIKVLGMGYNGKEAYQLYKIHKPDFVILDMKMPEYDGVYALKKIKAEDPNAKIIVVTGYSDYKFDRDEALAILNKPYEFDELLKTIKKAG